MTRVVTLPAERFIELTGTLHGQEEIQIAAEVPGRVTEIKADLGDVVEHGAQIAQIDRTNFQLVVDESRAALLAALSRLGLEKLPDLEVDLDTLPVVVRARAQAANAAARLDRARKLFERKPPLISEQDFADIQTQSDVAQAEFESERLSARALLADARVRNAGLARAMERLANTHIIAPSETTLRYRVAARYVSVGEVVAEGAKLFRLVASDRVKCRAAVPERFARDVRKGAAARLYIEGISAPFTAEVTRVSPAINATTRAFDIEMEADNASGQLKPGGFVRAEVLTGADPAARFVPEYAVIRFAGVHRVFSVTDGKVVEHRIRPGRVADGQVEITGLPAEVTSVIARPPRGIASGSLVKIVATSSAANTPLQ